MKYKLMEQAPFKHKTKVRITKEQVIYMFKGLTDETTGYIYDIEKVV